MKIAVFVMAIMVMCFCPGRISEEKDLVLVEQRRPKDCRSPKGKPGSRRTDGCIQSTCTNGKWKTKMRTDICCYKQQAHKPNTVLDKIVSADNCSLTTVGCGAVAQLEINHRTCSTPASEQQVEKLEINLEQKIEQVTAKIENVAETSGKLSEEIYNTVKEADKKIMSIEDKVDDLENNMESHVNDLSDQVQTLENSIEGLAQTVQDNIKDQAEMSLQIMRILANLTQLMEKHSEEIATCATNTPATTTTPTTTTAPATTTTFAAPTTTTPMVEGVLITGGQGAETSTELFLPHTGKTCSLQSLPANRRHHSMDTIAEKIILCGGYYTRTSCLEFLPTSSTGSWANYATLAQGRYYHTTHVFQGELLLLGGDGSRGTTEIIGKGTQYDLQQDTSRACTIPDQTSTILTGGYNYGSGYRYLNSVVRYNMQGFVENLPDLATARHSHGCGYYMDNGNKVLVVAGGWNGADLSSTELLLAGATSWTSGESLPRTLYAPSSTNMHGYLLLIGGYSGGYRGEVLKFDGTWTEVGMMKTARYYAAATKIEIPGEGGFMDISACI